MSKLTKKCASCGKVKSLNSFYKETRQKDGKNCYCKVCQRQRNKDNYQKNREKYKQWRKEYRESEHGKKVRRNDSYRREYGITLEDYNRMFSEQQGCCAICGKKEIHKNQRKIKRLGVDHNHQTGEVRGLLCQRCNILVSYVENYSDLVQKAKDYLERGNE